MKEESGAIVFNAYSPEKVALELVQMLSHIERKSLHSGPPSGWEGADRKWLLDTYSECILAIRDPVERLSR